MSNIEKKLTVAEWAELKALETVIKTGQQAFRDVGNALLTVKEKKLYREKFATFDEYCETKWGWTRQRAYQLIEATKAVASLPAKCQPLVDNERTAREVAKLPEPARAAVVVAAAEAGHVTAAAIREAAKPVETHDVDKTGMVIPKEILPEWNRALTFNEHLQELERVKRAVANGLKDEDIVFAEVTNTTLASLKACRSDLDRIIPHAVCPTCQGRQRKACKLCKGRGFISEFAYATFVPEKTREIRERAAKGGRRK